MEQISNVQKCSSPGIAVTDQNTKKGAKDMLQRALEVQQQMAAWRRDIHMHPELGFQEYRTARVVADTLRAMGLRVETGVGKTGVVGYLGEGRPAVGIRADMDALPLQEANDVPYASQTPGVMHACGHDAHVGILLGVARLLSEMKDRPPGEVRFLFQPCEETQDEEGKSGAMLMVEDGALAELDAVIALHVDSETPVGKVEIGSGYSTAAVDSFDATIIGSGCHGAYPHTGVDPIFILAQVINAIHGIRARRINPVRSAVISIGMVKAGEASNIIPNEVELNGTIRSFDDETRQQLWEELKIALGVARALGGDYQLTILKGFPSLYNAPEVAGVIRQVAEEMLGADGLKAAEAEMGAEDFSYMALEAPGAMFSLGAEIGDKKRPGHSPIFDLDESAFPIGAAILAETACRLLRSYAARS
jgi:amidohydrolase